MYSSSSAAFHPNSSPSTTTLTSGALTGTSSQTVSFFGAGLNANNDLSNEVGTKNNPKIGYLKLHFDSLIEEIHKFPTKQRSKYFNVLYQFICLKELHVELEAQQASQIGNSQAICKIDEKIKALEKEIISISSPAYYEKLNLFSSPLLNSFLKQAESEVKVSYFVAKLKQQLQQEQVNLARINIEDGLNSIIHDADMPLILKSQLLRVFEYFIKIQEIISSEESTDENANRIDMLIEEIVGNSFLGFYEGLEADYGYDLRFLLGQRKVNYQASEAINGLRSNLPNEIYAAARNNVESFINSLASDNDIKLFPQKVYEELLILRKIVLSKAECVKEKPDKAKLNYLASDFSNEAGLAFYDLLEASCGRDLNFLLQHKSINKNWVENFINEKFLNARVSWTYKELDKLIDSPMAKLPKSQIIRVIRFLILSESSRLIRNENKFLGNKAGSFIDNYTKQQQELNLKWEEYEYLKRNGGILFGVVYQCFGLDKLSLDSIKDIRELNHNIQTLLDFLTAREIDIEQNERIKNPVLKAFFINTATEYIPRNGCGLAGFKVIFSALLDRVLQSVQESNVFNSNKFDYEFKKANPELAIIYHEISTALAYQGLLNILQSLCYLDPMQERWQHKEQRLPIQILKEKITRLSQSKWRNELEEL